MVIDLIAASAQGAVACQAENNVAVVGPERPPGAHHTLAPGGARVSTR
jgi:hypothetical protein